MNSNSNSYQHDDVMDLAELKAKMDDEIRKYKKQHNIPNDPEVT